MLVSRTLLVTFGLALCAGWAGSAAAYHTRFVADNCNYAAPTPTSSITRDGSAAVALRGRHEGYQWGGGCWNDNDRDDSPGDPHENPATGGEGGDCSGFTFKVWREPLDTARRELPSVGAPPLRPRPVHRGRVQGGHGSTERHGVQVVADQDGRTRERRPHRPRLRGEPGRQRPDHRGERRGLRYEHLDAHLSGKLELQRRAQSWMELLSRLAPLPLCLGVALALQLGCTRDAAQAPATLVDGSPARPPPVALEGVDGSQIATRVRVASAGSRAPCALAKAARGPVVERIGVTGASVTFSALGRRGVHACDATDLDGSRIERWCAHAFGRLVAGRLRDPRLEHHVPQRRRRARRVRMDPAWPGDRLPRGQTAGIRRGVYRVGSDSGPRDDVGRGSRDVARDLRDQRARAERNAFSALTNSRLACRAETHAAGGQP